MAGENETPETAVVDPHADLDIPPSAPGPTEVTPHPLDAILAVEEAEITALEEAAGKVEDAPAIDETPPPAETETKTPEQVAAEKKAATETPPPAEPGEKKDVKSPTWKALREADRLAKENARIAEEAKRRADLAEKELRILKGEDDEEPRTPESKTDETELDTDKRIAKLEQEREQEKAEKAAKDLVDEIKKDEEDFAKDNPDYHEALTFLAETERKEYEVAGILDRNAADIMVNRPDLVEQVANARGMTEEQAAKEIAFHSILTARRQFLIGQSRAAGKRISEVAYSIAQSRGFKSTKSAEAEKEKAAADAKARVEQAKKLEPATKSLSNMAPAGSRPKDWRPQTRAEALELSEEQIDALDREDPNWLQRL